MFILQNGQNAFCHRRPTTNVVTDYDHDVVCLYPLCTLAAGIIQSQGGQRPFGHVWLFDSQSEISNQGFFRRLFSWRVCVAGRGFHFHCEFRGTNMEPEMDDKTLELMVSTRLCFEQAFLMCSEDFRAYISIYPDSLAEYNQLVEWVGIGWVEGGEGGVRSAREKWLARLTGRALLNIAGSLGGFHISPPLYNSWDVSRQCQQLFLVVKDIYCASGGGGGREAAAVSWWVRVSSTLAGDLSFTAAPLRHSLLAIIW